MLLSREEFMQQYVLTRTSHKKSIEELLTEASKAYSYICYPNGLSLDTTV